LLQELLLLFLVREEVKTFTINGSYLLRFCWVAKGKGRIDTKFRVLVLIRLLIELNLFRSKRIGKLSLDHILSELKVVLNAVEDLNLNILLRLIGFNVINDKNLSFLETSNQVIEKGIFFSSLLS